MDNSNILLIDKIIHLGKRLEKSKIYELLTPWSFDGSDSIAVQNAGKKISDFIGLPNLTFVINYTKEEKNTAGHIELNNNSDEGVFIEIDEKFKSKPKIILAILAHEICHKLIHINGLTQYGYENEILTDVATIYTGLGKLSLNGCETKDITTDTHWDGNERKTTTTTTTQKVGYLNRNQFAFLYTVICNMRRIPNDYATKGLNSNAVDAVNQVSFNQNGDLFHNDYVLEKVNMDLKKTNHTIHLLSALNTKLLKIFRTNIEFVNDTNREIHKKIKLTNEKYLPRANEKLNPESLNYIKNMKLLNELHNLDGLFIKEEVELSYLNSILSDFLFKLDGTFSINLKNRKVFYNIKCPVCGNNMRLKQDKLVKIKCTKCSHSFIVDNTNIDKTNRNNKQTKKSLKSKFKEIISILKE